MQQVINQDITPLCRGPGVPRPATTVSGDSPRAEQYFTEDVVYFDEHEVGSRAAFLRGERAAAQERPGRWDEAVTLSTALLVVSAGVSPLYRIRPLDVLGVIRARRGQPDAWKHLDEAAAAADTAGEPEWIIAVRLARDPGRSREADPARAGRARGDLRRAQQRRDRRQSGPVHQDRRPSPLRRAGQTRRPARVLCGSRARRWCARSGPDATGQDKPVPIRVGYRDTPPVPVRIARRDPGAARIDQAVNHALVDLAADVEDDQVLRGGRGWRRILGIADEFKMPGSTGPANHQQRVATFGGMISPEQYLESEAPDPESLRSPQVMTRPGDAHMISCTRLHSPILAQRSQGASDIADGAAGLSQCLMAICWVAMLLAMPAWLVSMTKLPAAV